MAEPLILTAELVDEVTENTKKFSKALEGFYKEQKRLADEAEKRDRRHKKDFADRFKHLGNLHRQGTREFYALQRAIGEISPRFGDMAAETTALAAGTGTVVGTLVAFGTATVVATKTLSDFGGRMRDLMFTSQRSGFTPQYLRAFEQAGAAWGISAEEMDQSAANMGAAAVRLRTDFDFFREQLTHFGMQDLAQPLVQRLLKNPTDVVGAFGDFIDGIQRIRQGWKGHEAEFRIDIWTRLFGQSTNIGRIKARAEFEKEIQKVIDQMRRMGLSEERINAAIAQATQLNKDTTASFNILGNINLIVAAELTPDFDKLIKDVNETLKNPLTVQTIRNLARAFDELIILADAFVLAFKYVNEHFPDWMKNPPSIMKFSQALVGTICRWLTGAGGGGAGGGGAATAGNIRGAAAAVSAGRGGFGGGGGARASLGPSLGRTRGGRPSDVGGEVSADALPSLQPTEGGGPINRTRFKDELDNNPALREKILRIAANEQGSNPQGVQAVLETMMNRAEVRGTSLAAQAKWYGAERGGYYQMGNMGRGALESPKHADILNRALNNALGGSNISNYATDNSSGSLAARERATGSFQFRSTYGGETFFAPGTAEPGLARKWADWHGKVSKPTEVAKGPHVEIGVPQIKGGGAEIPMQAGGIVTRPTLAMLGEGGPEAVVPLNKLQGLARQLAFITSIGSTETDFSRKQAYSEKYNLASTNRNVAKFGPQAADRGFYQMNEQQINRAVAMGMDPSVAQHLAGGGPGGTSSLSEQTHAVHEYLKLKYAKAYGALAAGGGFETMRRATMSEWHGLLKQGRATAAFNEALGPHATGQLDVHVNAPHGTQVKASGSGMFENRVNMRRSIGIGHA
jgi:hypothetical protein